MTSLSVVGLSSVINQLLPEPHAGLLSAILFGTKATIPRSLYNDLVTTGTIHIVALSGMNISIIAALVGKTLLWVISRRVASLLTLGFIAGFVWFVGPEPSIVRAAIMGSLSLIAIMFGRVRWVFLSWSLAVGIMLALRFAWLFDLSFQLSTLATLGIILFANTLRKSFDGEQFGPERIRQARRPEFIEGLTADGLRGGDLSQAASTRISESLKTKNVEVLHFEVRRLEDLKIHAVEISKSQVREYVCLFLKHIKLLILFLWSLVEDDLRITLAAQVFTIPVVIITFHRISLIAPVANVLIGWTIAPITVLGWVASVLGMIWLPLGQIAGWISWVLLEYLLLVVREFASIPFAGIGW